MNCSTPGLPVYHQLPEFTQEESEKVGLKLNIQKTKIIYFYSFLNGGRGWVKGFVRTSVS